MALFGSQGPEVLEAARPALVGALLARGEGGLSSGAGAAWARRTAAERQAAMCRAAREMLDRGLWPGWPPPGDATALYRRVPPPIPGRE